jgi:hypothetical protein
MQEEYHGIPPVFAPDGDPLLDTADLHIAGFIDTVWISDGIVLRIRLRSALIIASNFWKSASTRRGCAVDSCARLVVASEVPRLPSTTQNTETRAIIRLQSRESCSKAIDLFNLLSRLDEF